MKFIHKLEHSKSFWFLLFVSLGFFLLRLPSVIEPYWYGDEGIYEVIGQALRSGRFLYTQIWDNKPPLLYLIYAAFNGDQASVKFTSLIVGLLTVITFFYLAKQLLKNAKLAMITTACFAFLFATPFLEGNIANAENFMLLPITLAGLLIYHVRSHKPRAIFFAGILLGIAFLLKIVAIFDFAAFLSFILLCNLPKGFLKNRKLWRFSMIHDSLFLVLGFLIPFSFTISFFAYHHALMDFIQVTFFGNVSYVGEYNMFIIPHGLLVIKVLMLLLALVTIFMQRDRFSRNQLFIILWFVFATFNTFFSQRPYTHYLFVLLPSFCLLGSLCFVSMKPRLRVTFAALILVVLLLIASNFSVFGVSRTFQYYINTISFLNNKESLTSYQSFFDPQTTRDYEVAYFINTTIKESDNVFIWGDRAQIYALTHKLPPGRFTTAYHISNSEENVRETQKLLNENNPKAIVTLSEAPTFPFTMASFSKVLLLKDATVYEKDF